MPARRTHELRRLDNVVFRFQRRHDLHRPRADLTVQVGYCGDPSRCELFSCGNHLVNPLTKNSPLYPLVGDDNRTLTELNDSSDHRSPRIIFAQARQQVLRAILGNGNQHPAGRLRVVKHATHFVAE